jgi:3',5'-cyclic AMP phosphodiesterase CpdA
VLLAGAIALAVTGLALATHSAIDTEGHTTLDQVIAGADADGDPETSYQTLSVQQVDRDYLVRDRASERNPKIPPAQEGRESRRRSLAYFGQMTDFQFVDEESPARVEFVDAPFGQSGPASAWRPAEAFIPFATDASVRQMNRFAPASPVPGGNGAGNRMDFVLVTGDQADNSQRNETEWVRDVLEGGRPLNFNSGLTDPAAYTSPSFDSSPSCLALLAQESGPEGAAAEGRRYTGVQDYDDYPTGVLPDELGFPGSGPIFYDPDDVRGPWAAAGWPTYPGLMDRAQQLAITPEGLDVPFYLANGNHDILVQGNEDANQAFERFATGCAKVIASGIDPGTASEFGDLLNAATITMFVPPDPQRQFVSKPQIKQIYGATTAGDDDHGFGLVDPREKRASNDSASYYAWDPPETPGFRFISIDTNSEGGVVGPFGPQPTGSSDGNIDDPQFQWLKDELDAAQAAGKLIVVFGHHPIRSMDANIPDELAAPCTVPDPHGHDVNPGCDVDPRNSEPIHLGDEEEARSMGSGAKTVSELFAEYPNLVTYVPGHTHENRVIAYPKKTSDIFWEINTSAVIDHPQQSRLIEVFDNRDGTLSIFGTILDHASPATPPPGGTAGSGFDGPQLASVGRSFAFNDPQSGQAATESGDTPPPTGLPRDQNVELLLRDPRIARGKARCKGKVATIVGTRGRDKIKGTRGRDIIDTGPGKDRVKAKRGRDLVCGGKGKDKLKGGGGRDWVNGGRGKDRVSAHRGNDRPVGGRGGDRVKGGRGRDRVSGGKGNDRLAGGKGVDGIAGGAGKKDRCRAEQRRDRFTFDGCERVTGRGRG